eukprot:c14951_g2_i1 orf=156-437(-)
MVHSKQPMLRKGLIYLSPPATNSQLMLLLLFAQDLHLKSHYPNLNRVHLAGLPPGQVTCVRSPIMWHERSLTEGFQRIRCRSVNLLSERDPAG